MSEASKRLKKWAKQGAVKTAKKTGDSVRAALDAWEFPDGVRFSVYLQGSYRNSTNIRGDSDVDVVAELTSTFSYNVSQLPADQQRAFNAKFGRASYDRQAFRRDVTEALVDYYGSTYVDTSGNKAIVVEGRSGYLDADVVPCSTYRFYNFFYTEAASNYDEGIQLCTRDGSIIINFPKQHYENGCSKQEETAGQFKPTVRIFKNARTYLVDLDMIGDTLAPSYFLECLLYRVPAIKYRSNYEVSFPSILKWLWSNISEDMLCQNGITTLFGSDSTQWCVEDARTLTVSLLALWKVMNSDE